MLPIQPFFEHLIPLSLVVTRLGGLFVLGPVLSSVAIPARLRAMIALVLGIAVYQVVRAESVFPPATDLPGLLGLLVSEAAIGMVIGLIALLPLTALELTGMAMGHQMGLALARSFNPDLQTDSDVLGQMLYIFALLTYIAIGGLETMFTTLAGTYESIPVGSASLGALPIDMLVGVVASGFDLALRVAAPVALIVLAVLIVIGLIGKTVPQLNVMTLGFMVKIPVGLALAAASLAAVATATGDEMASAQRAIDSWIDSFSGGGGG